MCNRIIRWTLMLVLASLLSCPAGPTPTRNPAGTARLERIGGTFVVYLQGDPYEMGLQQGALLRGELHSLVQDYLYSRLVLEHGAGHLWLLAQARLLDREVPHHLRREMQGIADGAGLSYHDVLLLNIVPDLVALTRKLPSWAMFPALFSSTEPTVSVAQSSLCTAFAGWGRATAEGALFVGHSLDCAESDLLQHYLLITVRQPAHGNAFVAFGLAGAVGVWAGMNEEKLVVTLSSSPSLDVASSGQPLPFLLRQALEGTGDLPAASGLLASAPRLYGGNVILGDGKAPQAVALELSAHRYAVFEGNTEGDVLVRTNHFLDADLALTQRVILSQQERTSSEVRMARLSAVLKPNEGWISVDKALAFLVDARSPSASSVQGSSTLRSVLFAPGEFSVWVATGTPSYPEQGVRGTYYSFGGEGDDGAATQASYARLDFATELLGRP